MPYKTPSELPSSASYECFRERLGIKEIKILCEAGNFYTLSINRWDKRGEKLPTMFLGLFCRQ